MPMITTKAGAQIHYKDWGSGQPVVFSHGRSTQTWDGNEMDTYADDLVTLTETLDLKNAIHVGHSRAAAR